MSKLLNIIICLIVLSSCSRKYMQFNKAVKQFNKSVISQYEYDSIIGSFYTLKTQRITSGKGLYVNGTYICKEYSDYYKKNDFRALKLTDSAVAMFSYRFYDSLTNIKLANLGGVKYRYTVNQQEIIIEYLLNQDYKLYNVYKYGRINSTGDTITFYKLINIQQPRVEPTIIQEIFVYNKDLNYEIKRK